MAGCEEMFESAYFSQHVRHFQPSKIFPCKTAYAIFKVVYQASHIPKIRNNEWLPRRAQKRIFFTPFRPFSAKKKLFLAKLPGPYLK